MFCTKCGFQLEDGAKFCTNCGATVEQTAGTAEPVFTTESDGGYGGFVDSDIMELVGPNNAEYYNNRFNEMKRFNKKVTWNWAAFLIGPMWMFYRKMYNYGIIYLVFNVLLSQFFGGLSLVVSILVGVFGNYIYLAQLENLSLEAKQYIGTAKEAFVKEKGGTSGIAIFVCFAFSLVINLVWGMIFG